jgi:selenocysteine-specific translation elongation factor
MVIINLSILGVNLLGDESSTSNLSNNITNYV